MIEAFWRSMKHNWLFLNTLDSIENVQRHVSFYVHEHNSVMTHSGFRSCPARRSRPPDEVFFETATDIHEKLRNEHREAMRLRVTENREQSRSKCRDTS
jgi:hypothetical protein